MNIQQCPDTTPRHHVPTHRPWPGLEGDMEMVRKIVWKIRRQRHLPAHVDLDELLAAGMVGLCEARTRFDPSRGVTFTTFSGLRIHGAITDHLRKVCRFPDHEELDAENLGDAASQVDLGEASRFLSQTLEAIGGMPHQHRIVLEQIIKSPGATLDEIATIMGLSRSAANQRVIRARQILRDRMSLEHPGRRSTLQQAA